MVTNPTFDSRVKETLTSRAADFQGHSELPKNQLKTLMKTSIPDLICGFGKFKEDSQRKTLGDLQRGRLHRVKPIEANKAGKSQSQQCTLILTERDSAKGMAITEHSVIGQDSEGVFALKVVLVNVRNISAERSRENEHSNIETRNAI
jgi:DNA topoisomerase-2